jgi:hypothetical protein
MHRFIRECAEMVTGAKGVLKKVGLALALAVVGAGLFGTAVVWALGGPTEAWAIVRLDRAGAVPLTPLGLRTCYAPGFTHAGFLAVKPGDSMDTVRAMVGQPLEIVWSDRSDRRSVVFELQGERYVVQSRTYGMDVATGASMESVDPARRGLREVQWRYSRQCTYIDSNRVRILSFDAGRVTERHSGVYYD